MNKHIKNALLAALSIVFIISVMEYFKAFNRGELQEYEVRKENVQFTARDGELLSGDLFLPQKKDSAKNEDIKFPGVVMLAPYLESNRIYAKLAERLCKKGFAVLSVNLRSPKKRSQLAEIPENVRRLSLDAAASINFFSQHASVDSGKLAILGTAISARNALLGAGERKNVRCAVLVSAVVDSIALDVIRQSPFRPILVLASLQDGPAGAQAREIFDTSTSPDSHLEVYINAGEGSALWHSQFKSEMQTLIVDWLCARLQEDSS